MLFRSLKLPYGDLFTQPHNKTNTVFIAGGTGITPFLSLFSHESFNEYISPRIYLGFRSKAFNIYQSELDLLCNSFKSVKIFMEDIEGLIDLQSIYRESNLLSDYFISGPPAMIKNLRRTLLDYGVAHDQIKTDDWE